MKKNDLIINVGPLNSISSLCYHISDHLQEYSKAYLRGNDLRVIWDLTLVESPHMKMQALTAFLSIAHRLRLYSKQRIFAKIKWSPNVLSFWHDIGFLSLVKRLNLFEFDEKLLGGFKTDTTNPSTGIGLYEIPLNGIPSKENLKEWKDWKDDNRIEVFSDLTTQFDAIFVDSAKMRPIPKSLKHNILTHTAEIVINSWLHGYSTAFVGCQRSGVGISVVICDSGRGFFHSFQNNHRDCLEKYEISDNISALLLGSMINDREFGLRQIISEVTSVGGHVHMFSFDAEIIWKEHLWKAVFQNYIEKKHDKASSFFSEFGCVLKRSPSYEEKEYGYFRKWINGLKGSKIAFEIPIVNR